MAVNRLDCAEAWQGINKDFVVVYLVNAKSLS